MKSPSRIVINDAEVLSAVDAERARRLAAFGKREPRSKVVGRCLIDYFRLRRIGIIGEIDGTGTILMNAATAPNETPASKPTARRKHAKGS